MFSNLRLNLFTNVHEAVKLTLLRGKTILKLSIEYVYTG